MRRLAFVVIALAVFATQGAFAQDAARLLKAAINTEMVDGNPKAAIDQYKKVAASGDRALAAQALLRMAGCYQKLGDAEAQKILAQIVRDYADQTEVAAEARGKMVVGDASRARPAPDESRAIWTVPEDVRILGPVSVDGRFLPISVRGGGGELAVRDLQTGTDRIIPSTPAQERARSEGAFRAGESVVSRDGRRVASRVAVSRHPGMQVLVYTQLVVSNVGDGSATTLIDGADVVPYDWTPDGGAIAIRRKVSATTQQIEIVSFPSGAVRVLRTIEWRANGPFSGRLSPDGRRLAVETPANGTGARDIIVLPIDGGPEVRVVQWTGDDILLGWSPDGASVLFSSARGSGTLDIWRQRLDAKALALGPELVRRNGPARPLGMTLSGALFSHDDFEAGAGACQTTPTCEVKESVFDFETGTFVSPPRDVSDTYVRSNESPRWSPDGTRLAYYARRGGREGVIVIKDLATGQSREVSPKFLFTSGNRHRWDWAPDGRALIAQGQDVDRGSAEFALHRIDLETGEVSLILPTLVQMYFTHLSWSADGRTLYYHRASQNLSASPGRSNPLVRVARDVTTGAEREFPTNGTHPWFEGKAYGFREDSQGGTIIENDTATGRERALLRVYGEGFWVSNFRLTKDGRTVVASTVDPTTNEGTVVVCSVADASVKAVFRDARGRTPRVEVLSRDDRSAIVSSTNREGSPVYWWVPFDGRAPKVLDEMTGMNLLTLGARWQKIELHPDGRRLAFGVIYPEVSPRRILVLENVLSTPKR
jgi:Tol biopolymer transport system component